jgi:hypothetical protein
MAARRPDKDKASNEDLWDVTKTSDNCLSLRTAASNRPSPNTWLIPAGWPEGYAKILSAFWQIENHGDKGIAKGKGTLLLYQAREYKAWHDELKAGHFFNLTKLNEKKMNTYRKEVDAEHNTVVRKVPIHHPLKLPCHPAFLG